MECGGGGGGYLKKGCCLPPLSSASFFGVPWNRQEGRWWMKGAQQNGLRSGHMSGNGGHAGPFQAVTVNLFDLSLCKSL